MFNSKARVRGIALAITVAFLLGVVGMAITAVPAAAAPSSTIGVVNMQMLVEQHPDTAKAQHAMEQEVELAKKDFEAKTANMNDKEKQDYANQLQQRLMIKEQELRGSIFDKINASIKTVADSKGLSVVIEKGAVMYGGTDITDEVVKKFK